MDISEIVNEFISAVTAKDFDRAFALCTEDMIFENVCMDSSITPGRERIRQLLERMYEGCTYINYEILSEAVAGDTLLNERIDHHRWDDGAGVSIRVMGRFDVVDGLISLWRDYYDADQWHRNFEGGFVAYLQRRESV